MASGEWRVVEYERMRGDFPIRTYLASLTGKSANNAAALLVKLAARGNMMRPPESKLVTGQKNLFELRDEHQVRIFYMFLPGRVIVLLDGIIKKQDKIPTPDLARVVGYQRAVERRGPRAP